MQWRGAREGSTGKKSDALRYCWLEGPAISGVLQPVRRQCLAQHEVIAEERVDRVADVVAPQSPAAVCGEEVPVGQETPDERIVDGGDVVCDGEEAAFSLVNVFS